MARDKTVIDVLAELPPDELARMREKNQRDLVRARAEVARLELQEQQFDAATTKRERGKPGRPGALTPDLVMDAVVETEPPATAAAVRETLAAGGLEVTVNAVRNHLNRLADRGDLEKREGGKYIVPPPLFVPADIADIEKFTASPADDDIPF